MCPQIVGPEFVYVDLLTHSLYSSKCGHWMGTLKSLLIGNHAIAEPGGKVSVQSDAARSLHIVIQIKTVQV